MRAMISSFSSGRRRSSEPRTVPASRVRPPDRGESPPGLRYPCRADPRDQSVGMSGDIADTVPQRGSHVPLKRTLVTRLERGQTFHDAHQCVLDKVVCLERAASSRRNAAACPALQRGASSERRAPLAHRDRRRSREARGRMKR